MRRDAFTHLRGVWIGAGAILGFLLFLMIGIPLLGDRTPIAPGFHEYAFLVVLVVGVSWFGAGIWSDLNTSQSRQGFLTIPASLTEKYLSKFLISGPIFIVVIAIAYQLFSWVCNAAAGILGMEYDAFELFTLQNGTFILFTLVLHPANMLVGIWFNRFAYIKGALVITLIEIVFFGLLGFISYYLFKDLGDQVQSSINFSIENLENYGMAWVDTLGQILFWGFLGPFFVYLGFIRLKEREA